MGPPEDASISMRVYHKGSEVLVAACDRQLLGRTLKEGTIHLKVGSFYDGDRVTPEEFLRHLALATVGNFVGRLTVEAASEGGYVDEGNALYVEGVPHAQMVRV